MHNRIKKVLPPKETVQEFCAEWAKFAPNYAVLDESGNVVPCDLLTWAYWLERGRAQRIIAQEDLPGGYWLSTVFLGLNHQYAPGAPPLWFETMVFAPPDGKYSELLGRVPLHGPEVSCDRYNSLPEALAGHQMVKDKYAQQLQRQCPPPQR